MRLAWLVVAGLAVAGCHASSTGRDWRWYKADGTPAQFEMDHGQCTAQAFQGGASNLYSIAIVQDGCLRGKGWTKVPVAR